MTLLRALLSCIIAGLAAAQPLLNVCYEPWLPYAYTRQTDQHQGAAVDAMRLAFARMGYDLAWQALPYARCLSLANKDQIDLLLFSSPDLTLEFADSQVALAYWSLAAFVADTSPIKQYESLAQFKGQRIGVVNRYTYGKLRVESSAQADQAPDPESNLRKLAAGHVDVVFEDIRWGRQFAAMEHLGIRPLLPLAEQSPSFVGFSPRHSALIKPFDRQLRRMLHSGELDRIYQSHTGSSYRALDRPPSWR
ncbi:substrate-binding periplasmic protein [Chitinimonas sp.]|uniref:substrate-binding periplasmic protein n=1 Tax=Chitinimonas sp. TaxID=1934313 RepID=UPI0035AE122A